MTKLMIVDDGKMIIGSANINDRSLWGSRDSELAVFMDGQEDTILTSSSSRIMVNQKIHEFRTQLFVEHFGLDLNEVRDPNNEYFWATAWNIAAWNRDFYEGVFKVYPSDKYKDWKDLKNRTSSLVYDEAGFEKYKNTIRGHAVLYPYLFLRDVKLKLARRKAFSLLVMPIRVLL